MIGAIVWKEYREQRAIWLAIVLLATVLLVSVPAALGGDEVWRRLHAEEIQITLNLVLVAMCATYGIVCGAMLLAGESDERTEVFLDTLAGKRGPLFLCKVCAGVLLTGSLCLILAAIGRHLGFAYPEALVALPVLGMDALACGLLGGAMWRSVLAAALGGIVILVISLTSVGLLFFAWMGPADLIEAVGRPFDSLDWSHLTAVVAMLALVIASVSSRIYCHDDALRRQWPVTVLPTWRSWAAVVWLTCRQARLNLVLGAALSCGVVWAIATFSRPDWLKLLLWASGSLLLGLVCGLSVFASDQRDGKHYLAAQRLPIRKFWTTKILFWGIALCVLAVVPWVLMKTFVDWTLRVHPSRYLAGVHETVFVDRLLDAWAISAQGRPTPVDNLVFFGLWPLYGFCFGQFFSQASPSPIRAAILAFMVTPFFVALWIPTLLIGGSPLWQLLAVPALLLLMTRLTMRRWVTDRLSVGRSFLQLIIVLLVTVEAQLGACVRFLSFMG